jgi:hypothetical protein
LSRSTFDAANVARSSRPDIERTARLHDAFPQLVAAAAIPQVDLIADLAGPSGARDHHRNAVQIGLQEVIIAQGQPFDLGPCTCTGETSGSRTVGARLTMPPSSVVIGTYLP